MMLAGEQPLAEAKQVVPTMEDAYMWLMGRKERKQGGQPLTESKPLLHF
jgi:hypothetical protein